MASWNWQQSQQQPAREQSLCPYYYKELTSTNLNDLDGGSWHPDDIASPANPLTSPLWNLEQKTQLALAGLPQWIERGLWTKGSLVRFLVRSHTWIVGQVPSEVHVRGNHTLMFLSLFLPPFPSLKINLKNLEKKTSFKKKSISVDSLVEHQIIPLIPFFTLHHVEFLKLLFLNLVLLIWERSLVKLIYVRGSKCAMLICLCFGS